MKKNYLQRISAVALLSLSLVACSRKGDEEPEVKLTAQTLAGKYILTSLTVETSLTPPMNAINQLTACQQDNIYELKADSTANYIDAGVKCDPEESYGFKYSMTTNTVYLLGLKNSYFSGGNVKVFDGKTLILETKVKSPQTNNQEVTVAGTLVKQNI